MTLDRETYSTSVTVPDLSDGVDMTTDGTLLYDTEERTRPNSELRQMTRAGTVTTIWKCPTTGMFNNCYSNVVSWDPATDTVLLSFPESNNVAQIDRKTGTLRRDVRGGDGQLRVLAVAVELRLAALREHLAAGDAAGVVAPAAIHEGQPGRAQPTCIRGVHDRSNEQEADEGLDLR